MAVLIGLNRRVPTPAGVEFVYRAIRSKKWRDREGRPTIEAFRRRPHPPVPPRGSDPAGLSVTYGNRDVFSSGMDPIRLRVRSILLIGLDIAEVPAGHPNITGVPYDEPGNFDQVFEVANALIGCCEGSVSAANE